MIAWETVEDAIVAFVRAGAGLPSGRVIWEQGASRPPVPWISLEITRVKTIGHDGAGKQLNPLELDPLSISAFDPATNRLTVPAHGLVTADGELLLTTGAGLPPELDDETPYWAVVVDEDELQLATSIENALDGVAVDFSTAGSGSHTLVGTANTWRLNQEIRHTSFGHREAVVQLQCYGQAKTGSQAPRALLERVTAYGGLRGQIAALSAAGVGLAAFTPVQTLTGFVGPANVGTFEPRAVMEMRFFLASEVEEYSTFIARAQLTNQLTGTTKVVELQE